MIPFFGFIFILHLVLLVYSGNYIKQDYIHSTVPHLLVSIITSLILIHLVSNKSGNGYSIFFEHPTLRFFGKYSYGLYVYHYLFAPSLRNLPIEHFPGGYTLGMIAYSVCYLLLPLIISLISYHIVEKPILSLKTRFFITKS